MSIFDHGATLLPDVVTEAEEERILLRISQAPWMTDLSRRVQHYGYRYDYRQRGVGRHEPAAPFPRWADRHRRQACTAVRWTAARAVHRQRVPPRPGDRHARRSPVLRAGRHLVVPWRRVDDELPAPQPAPLRPRRTGVRRGRPSPASLRALVLRGPARSGLDARHRSRRQRGAQPDANLRDVQDAGAVAPPPFVSVPTARTKPTGRHRGGRQTRGRRSFGGVSGKGTEREPARSSTHRHQPGLTGDTIMAFGVNMAQVLGRLGDDVAINHLASGGRVANMSIATTSPTSTCLAFHDAPCWDSEVDAPDLVIPPSRCTPCSAAERQPHRSRSSDTGSDA